MAGAYFACEKMYTTNHVIRLSQTSEARPRSYLNVCALRIDEADDPIKCWRHSGGSGCVRVAINKRGVRGSSFMHI